MRWKRLVDRNNLVGAFLLGLSLFLHGGFETLLRSSPVASFEGYNFGSPTWGREAEVRLYDLGYPPAAASESSPSRLLNIRWSDANRPSGALNGGASMLFKCEYRIWDGEIVHGAGVPVGSEERRFEWSSCSGGPFWFWFEGMGGLALTVLSAGWFRRSRRRANARGFLGESVLVAYVVTSALVGAWVGYVGFTDWLFRLKAETLLRQVQGLELRKSTWQDASSIRRIFAPDSTCSPGRCDFDVDLEHGPMARSLVDLLGDGPLRRTLRKVSLLTWKARRLAGGQWARVTAAVRVRNGIVWGKDFSVVTAMPSDSRCGFAVSAETVRGFHLWSRPPWNLNSAFGGPDGCSCCTARWAKVTPYASAEEVREAFAFDLSCLGPTLHTCSEVRRLHPAADRRYEDQGAGLSRQERPTWTPEVYQRFGRDSESAAVVVVRWVEGEYKVTEMLQGTMRAPPRLSAGSLPALGQRAILFWDHHSERVVAPFSDQGVQAVRAGIAEAAGNPL